MVARFRSRAEAVRNRGLPPIEGPDRQRFIEQAQVDFMESERSSKKTTQPGSLRLISLSYMK